MGLLSVAVGEVHWSRAVSLHKGERVVGLLLWRTAVRRYLSKIAQIRVSRASRRLHLLLRLSKERAEGNRRTCVRLICARAVAVSGMSRVAKVLPHAGARRL